jgi:bifunctional DNA-binding transcriptional regulator/antitoxin component of YhaV-PrlF toxin-antitoxin module
MSINLDADMSFRVSLDSKGRVLLPVELRKKAAFKKGDLLNISLGSDRVAHISSMHQKISSLRGIWQTKRKGKSIVDEFLQERRKEALLDD